MTRTPLETSRRTTAPPMNPAPPVTRIRFIASETRVDVGEQGRRAVLVRQDQGGAVDRPVDTDRRVVEADRPVMLPAVGRGNLVLHLAVRLEREEAVGEAAGD